MERVYTPDGMEYIQDPDKQGWTGHDLPKNGDYPAIVKVAPEDTLRSLALAMLAGARTIETRRNGGIFILDPLGFNGGPHELYYNKAAEILRKEGGRILKILEEG